MHCEPFSVTEFLETLGDRRRHEIERWLVSEGPGVESRPELRVANRELQQLANVIMFGSLASLILFCGRRWNNPGLLNLHYLLRSVIPLRNAAAHGQPIIPGFSSDRRTHTPVDTGLAQALAQLGISRRLRQAHLRNPTVRRIATLMYTHGLLVPDGGTKDRAQKAFCMFLQRAQEHLAWYEPVNPFVSSCRFLERLTPLLGVA